MKLSAEISRREFLRCSALSAAAMGTAAALDYQTAMGKSPTNKKTKIRIGVRFNEHWLKSKNDEDLQFFKQIGVDYADIALNLVEGYEEHGVFAKADLKAFVDRLAIVGLKIERANSLGSYYLNAHLHGPERQEEINKLRRIGEMVTDFEIPVFGIQACQAAMHIDNRRAGWVLQQRRGGYEYYNFNIARSIAGSPKPRYKVTADQLWKGLLNIYQQVMPTVEGSKTKIAMHGNDPPLYQYLGNPQIICRFADFDRLFREVPSEHNGITFCCGTRYELGEDVLKGIRHFGKQGKLFHVHFRNVRGTLPRDKGYSEVFVDDGDMNMAHVVRALNDVDYDGVIDFDHPMYVTGDKPLPKQYIAFAVGYIRGLLQSL